MIPKAMMVRMSTLPASGAVHRKVPRLRDDHMNPRSTTLRNCYLDGLRSYLHDATRPWKRAALRLGRQAVALGLETLELAQIHRSAIDALTMPRGKGDLHKRAECFFAEATTPIVVLHSAACRNTRRLNQLKRALRARTSALSRAHRTLRHNVAKRRSTEAALKESSRHRGNLLRESNLVRDSLHLLTRKVLKAQEHQRSQISHDLQDDIAQTLIGINARLLFMRNKAGKGSAGIVDDLATTQRLVAESQRSMRAVTSRIRVP